MMSYLDPADRLRSLLERMHHLSASRRRAELSRSQETAPMTDRYRILLERVRAGRWHAETVTLDRHGDPELDLVGGTADAGGPAEVLELVGQMLDRLEADRLTRETRVETGPATVEEAVDRRLDRDVARVVEVLEDSHADDPRLALDPLHVAQRAGFVAEARARPPVLARPAAQDAAAVEEAIARARRALERAERDGVAARRCGDLGLWSLQHDDEIEAGR